MAPSGLAGRDAGFRVQLTAMPPPRSAALGLKVQAALGPGLSARKGHALP